MADQNMGDVPQLRPLSAPAPVRRSGKSFGQNPLVVAALDKLNRLLPWQRLPPLLGAVWLAGYREVQRAKNLYDTSAIPAQDPAQPAPPDPRVLQYRTSEGSYNDLSDPQMGMAGTRFGRNFPLHAVYPEPLPALLEPSPRAVSRKLMTREAFQPATTLNLLAAAWIQYQTHDWFNHGEPLKDDQFAIPLEPGDPWPENPMRVGRTAPDPTRVPGAHDGPPTYVNPASHWWDGSNVYGSTAAVTQRLRTMEDGKLIVKNRRLPIDPETGIAITGFNDNWWVGLGLLHTLFALEHNAICDRLRSESPSWSDDQLFETARLINGALMAKIHTVEWTPGILAHPTLRLGMRANWWGLAEERLYRLFGRLSGSDVVSGIPGSVPDHHSAPYSLTEEFAAVYRLHPLIPDEIDFRSLATGAHLKTMTFTETAFRNAENVIDERVSVLDVLYSFGTAHPGAITLHNYPRSLQDLQMPDGRRLDLAAVDILRDRERGVPRYNEFRRLLHLRPADSFETLTDNPQWARELRELYENDIERVDSMVGMYAETPPRGFGFSDTAFRIFVLMATRRLKSDRFFTTDYTPEVYTPAGMQWLNDNTMVTVLLRHYPELTPTLRGARNAFAPWQRIW
jgi:hypothetical protein